MSHRIGPGDLVMTVGGTWSLDWRNTVALIIKQYGPRQFVSDEPRWLAMTGMGEIVVYADEVDIINRAC